MQLTRSKIFYGWFVIAGAALVTFGVSGAFFSFGVFLKPMTEDFGWGRATLSLAFGITLMISGLLRPAAGYLADRYSPKMVVMAGVAIMGAMFLLIPLVQNQAQLYAVFSVLAIGLTLGVGPILTKIVSSWFHGNRGSVLGLVYGAGSIGGMVLVPGSSLFLVLADWRVAYWFLGLMLLVVMVPIGLLLIKNRPQDMGLEPLVEPAESTEQTESASNDRETLFGRDATFREAVATPFFAKLTFGYFV